MVVSLFLFTDSEEEMFADGWMMDLHSFPFHPLSHLCSHISHAVLHIDGPLGMINLDCSELDSTLLVI